jgi:hypothetical protein
MKRVVLILIAALLVLLVYPSTHPLSASPRQLSLDGPYIQSPKIVTPPIDLAGEDDDGDADSVGGVKGSKSDPNTSSINNPDERTRFMLIYKMWWNFLIRIR